MNETNELLLAEADAIIDAGKPVPMPDAAPPIVSKGDQQKIGRMINRALRDGYPLQTTHGGKVATDGYGRTYMRQRGRGNVRVVFDEAGQPSRLKKWNKARRKAERRALVQSRAANTSFESVAFQLYTGWIRPSHPCKCSHIRLSHANNSGACRECDCKKMRAASREEISARRSSPQAEAAHQPTRR